MRTIVIHRPGSQRNLRLEQRPDPRPASGEVAIDVEAIGVNYADVVVRLGLYASARDYVGWPITPGFEVAGTVVACGPGVDGLHPGQPVLGVTRFGGYASRVVLPERQVFPRPRRLSAPEAAGLPTVFLTAYYALFELCRPRPDEAMLVHSAAGGVGSALCQLGRVAGCRVVGVVGGAHKVQAARSAGAHSVIDKSSRALWPEARRLSPGGYHAVFDANGVSTLKQSFEHLRPMGRLVVYGFHSMLPHSGRVSWPRLAWSYLRTPRFNPLEMTQKNRSVLAFNLSYLFEQQTLLQESMGQLLSWLAKGTITPPPVTTYPLEQAARAHADLESGQTVGKLVLLP